MPQFALANHVFVCVQGGHVVFLDVREDRYFALDAQKTVGLAALVPGWPVADGRSAPDHANAIEVSEHIANPSYAPILELLLQRGLLLKDGSVNGKAATPISLLAPIAEITAEEPEDLADADSAAETREPSARRSSDIVAFIKSTAFASMLLKMRSFESVIRRAARRREAHARQNLGQKAGQNVGEDISESAAALDTARAQRLITSFTSLRPFFFSGKDECLFEALALSEFLAQFEIFPSWVFGVQARPFAAHCWLQQDGIVLNDTVEHVSRYTPIMSI